MKTNQERKGEEMKSMISKENAYRFNDNFQVVVESTDQCIGVEHNQSEANAIAQYLTSERGVRHVVVPNGRDAVCAARAIRKDCVRVCYRDEILAEMGIK